MFLDDELYEMVIEFNKNAYFSTNQETVDGIQKLNKDVKLKCQEYYQSKINETSSTSDIKNVLDRTFNLFDAFVKRLLSSDDKILKEFGVIFEKNSFREAFMNNSKLAKIYQKL